MITPDRDAVVTEIEIAAPPARVFQALTDERALMSWFTNATCPVKFWKMDARPGGHYSYTTQQGTAVVNNFHEFECHGDILEFDPPRTVVRWELTPIAGGTHVKVTHAGLAQEQAARKDYAGGWPGVLAQLKKFTEP
jgi:uncharacterized protein YndB with AHSA1/START domain